MSDTDAPIYLDVDRYDPDEDPVPCAVCGDDIEPGDEFVWEPAPELGYRNAIVMAHPPCSVRNGFRLRYPDERTNA